MRGQLIVGGPPPNLGIFQRHGGPLSKEGVNFFRSGSTQVEDCMLVSLCRTTLVTSLRFLVVPPFHWENVLHLLGAKGNPARIPLGRIYGCRNRNSVNNDLEALG